MNSSSPSSTPQRYLQRICSSSVIRIGIALVLVALVATLACVDTTVAFRACFGTLLALFGCAQIYMAVKLIRNRRNPLLELSQPIPMSIFAIAGAIATLTCFMFALPAYSVSCAIRQPIIFTSISIMGSILVSKAWRISSILSPTLSFASASTNSTHKDKVQLARIRIMNGFNTILGWTRYIGSCGKDRSRRRNSAIRSQVTLADLMYVTACLLLPQILLQIINLSVTAARMQSIQIGGIHMCQSDIGYWFLAPGIVLALAPFVLALILNVKSQSSMPDVLREYDQILNSMKIAIGVLSITLPTVAMISQSTPNAHAYLMSASLLSFVLPLSYNIAWTKIWAIRKSTNGRTSQRRRSPTTVRRTNSEPTSSSLSDKDGDSLETLKDAEDAAVMGTMYSNIGSIKKALEVDADILSMFKDDGEYSSDKGFSDTEIRRFGPKTLQAVTSALINNAKHWNTSMHLFSGEEKDNCIRKSTKSCLDALRIFRVAPAKLKLKDRSAVFPGYSLLAVLIKSGDVNAPEDQRPSDFEEEVASRFVQETQFALFHHCRSLSLKAEFLAKNQSFENALVVVEDIKLIYNPALHSKAIADEYSLDHAGNIVSMSALWLYHLDRPDEALVVCNYVIDTILPVYGEKDLLGLTLLLLPIIKVLLKTQGCEGARRGRELYDRHIFKPGGNRGGFAKPVMRPLMILLTCSSTAVSSDDNNQEYDGMDDDISWVLNGEDKIDDWGDTVMMKTISWGPTTILCEACLYLAKRLGSGEKHRALLEEGIRLSKLAEPKMKDSERNGITLPIAYPSHAQVYSELRYLSVPV